MEEKSIFELLNEEAKTMPTSVLMGVGAFMLQDIRNSRIKNELDSIFQMKYSFKAKEELIKSFHENNYSDESDEKEQLQVFSINMAKEFLKKILSLKRTSPENPQIDLKTNRVSLNEVECLIARLTNEKKLLDEENKKWVAIERSQEEFLDLCRQCNENLDKNIIALLDTTDYVVAITKNCATLYQLGDDTSAFNLCNNVDSVEQLLSKI